MDWGEIMAEFLGRFFGVSEFSRDQAGAVVISATMNRFDISRRISMLPFSSHRWRLRLSMLHFPIGPAMGTAGFCPLGVGQRPLIKTSFTAFLAYAPKTKIGDHRYCGARDWLRTVSVSRKQSRRGELCAIESRTLFEDKISLTRAAARRRKYMPNHCAARACSCIAGRRVPRN